MRSQPVDPVGRVVDAGLARDVTDPSVVELPSSGPLRAGRGTDRWLAVVLAVCAAVVCMGFMGHAATSSPASAAPIGSPTAQPQAQPQARPVGRVVPDASPPPESASLASSVAGLTADDLLGAISPVSVWRLEPVVTGGGPVAITVDGYASSTIDSVTVVVRTSSGALLRSAVAPLAVADERPGLDGQRRHGLGTFHLRIVLVRSMLVEGCLIETSWRDPATGTQGSSSQVLPGIGG